MIVTLHTGEKVDVPNVRLSHVPAGVQFYETREFPASPVVRSSSGQWLGLISKTLRPE